MRDFKKPAATARRLARIHVPGRPRMSRRINRRRFVRRAAIGAGVVMAGFPIPAVVLAAESWGDMLGRFVYDGKSPPREKLKVDKDVDCCGKFDIRDESLMIGSDGGLANVFVYVRTRKVEVSPELEPSLSRQVKLDNKDCIFQPHCLTVWYAKQELYIVNSDPIAQNVDFRPLADLPANIILSPAPGKNVEATWKFNKAQITPVKVACNYHPWESAYILPRDNPYFAISAADGTFRIAKLPVGKIEFQCWHERVGYLDTPQWTRGRFEWEVKAGTNNLGTIKLPPKKFENPSRLS
jgi:hypothetical protein